MPLAARQKACIPCATSKRKCDKQLPECRRCIDRDVDCAYPQPRRRRRDTAARKPRAVPDVGFPDIADGNVHAGDFGLEDWPPDNDLNATIPGLIDIHGSGFVARAADASTTDPEIGYTDLTDVSCPWFLRGETWVLAQNNEEPGCVTNVELQPFIEAVNEMLQSWVKAGHNHFVHRRLYETGMPRCLQHAFITLAAYLGRTPAMKETILQIAEDHASDLVLESLPAKSEASVIRNQLAHVQALFIYTFIRLFDGSIRLRASAETQLPILRQWLAQLYKTTKNYRGEDRLLGHGPVPWLPNHFDMEYNATSELWKLWILTESVRRTHLVAGTVANMYEIMVKGWVECSGAVMFTARNGLWDADSVMKWYELSCAKSPLLVPALQPGSYIAGYAADEFDEFVKLIWTFIVGADKVQCWIDKSRTDFLPDTGP
jgi:hypothetical protein